MKDTIRLCSECDEEIEVLSKGDEYWDFCPNCQQIEGDTYETEEE